MTRKLYNKEYAKKWLNYAVSGQDGFRNSYLFPYLQQIIADRISKDKRQTTVLLDIGCGWGGLLNYIPKEVEYIGVDPVHHFFKFIQEKHADRKMILKKGELPNKIPVNDASFDIVVCSMALHCLSDLETSVNTIFSKAKLGAQVIIAEFNDYSPPIVRKTFASIGEEKGNYVKGIYRLSNDTCVPAEGYFHGEERIEQAIKSHASFKKTMIGPLFVGYEAVKGVKN